MSLLCKIFGHKHQGDDEYFIPVQGTTDGIRRQHWRLLAQCDRCDEYYQIGNIHGPLGCNEVEFK